MARFHINSRIMIWAICGVLLVNILGCKRDEAKAPPLPPDESMIIDLSIFGISGDFQTTQSGTYRNFAAAVALTGVISAAVITYVSVPSAIFAAAQSIDPVLVDNNTWLWSYSKDVEGNTYKADLTAQYDRTGISWSMKVSTDNPYYPLTDFEWYAGESSLDNISGSWQFYDIRTPEEANPTVSIEWFVEDTNAPELIVSNNDPRSEYMNSTLHYNVYETNATMIFYNASENITGEAHWNLESGAGNIKWARYNDGEQACWDTNQQDIPCE